MRIGWNGDDAKDGRPVVCVTMSKVLRSVKSITRRIDRALRAPPKHPIIGPNGQAPLGRRTVYLLNKPHWFLTPASHNRTFVSRRDVGEGVGQISSAVSDSR